MVTGRKRIGLVRVSVGGRLVFPGVLQAAFCRVRISGLGIPLSIVCKVVRLLFVPNRVIQICNILFGLSRVVCAA